MSHLKTIIIRIKKMIENLGEKEAINDPLFQQAIVNLMEYQDTWNDFTEEEQKEADLLYAKYSKYLNKEYRELLNDKAEEQALQMELHVDKTIKALDDQYEWYGHY